MPLLLRGLFQAVEYGPRLKDIIWAIRLMPAE